MADVALNPQDLNGTAGRALAFVTPNDVVDVYRMPNNGRSYLVCKNGVGAVDVEIETHRVLDSLTVPDKTVRVSANTEALLGPFDPALYDDSEKRVSFTLSAITNVTVAAFRV